MSARRALYALLIKRAADQPRKPHAVIILGNPNRNPPPRPGTLYDSLQKYLENKGYRVTRDPGEDYSEQDPSADVWIGHSRGAWRLQFAPPHVITIPMGSHRPGAVNHPDDVVDLAHPDDFDKLPDKARQAHSDWHPSMAAALDKLLPVGTLP